MKLPRMILFDYGQTLVDEAAYDRVAGDEAVLRHAVDNPQGVTAQQLCDAFDALYAELGYMQAATETPGLSLCRCVYGQFGLKFDVSMEELERVFFTCVQAQPTPGAPELLEALAARGIRMGVVSNISYGESMLRYILAQHVPEHLLQFVLTSADVVFRKPHRRIFELALRRAGLAPQEVWFCGDHPVSDVQGAAACGMRAFWYLGANRRTWENPPLCQHETLQDWQQLRDLLNI